MNKYYHIGINFKTTSVEKGKIEAVLDEVEDWVRYAPSGYIIYDSSTPSELSRKLRVVLDKQSFFICEINKNNRAGWLPKIVWDWLAKDR